jgi:hypothetical protein
MGNKNFRNFVSEVFNLKPGDISLGGSFGSSIRSEIHHTNLFQVFIQIVAADKHPAQVSSAKVTMKQWV